MKALKLHPDIVTHGEELESDEDVEDVKAMKAARKMSLSFRPLSEYLHDRKPWHMLRGAMVIHSDLTEPVMTEDEVEAGFISEARLVNFGHDDRD